VYSHKKFFGGDGGGGNMLLLLLLANNQCYGKKVQSTQQMVGVIYLFIATCFGRFWPSSGNIIDKLA
jgi:hypothetical protein